MILPNDSSRNVEKLRSPERHTNAVRALIDTIATILIREKITEIRNLREASTLRRIRMTTDRDEHQDRITFFFGKPLHLPLAPGEFFDPDEVSLHFSEVCDATGISEMALVVEAREALGHGHLVFTGRPEKNEFFYHQEGNQNTPAPMDRGHGERIIDLIFQQLLQEVEILARSRSSSDPELRETSGKIRASFELALGEKLLPNTVITAIRTQIRESYEARMPHWCF
jgi:hypothetical protein